jgi:hypothetical protein
MTIDHDHCRAGGSHAGAPDMADVHTLPRQEGVQFVAEPIGAQLSHHHRGDPQPCRRDSLVGSLAPGKESQVSPHDRLADTGTAVSGRHHIHVDAAHDDDLGHVCPPACGRPQRRRPRSPPCRWSRRGDRTASSPTPDAVARTARSQPRSRQVVPAQTSRRSTRRGSLIRRPRGDLPAPVATPRVGRAHGRCYRGSLTSGCHGRPRSG